MTFLDLPSLACGRYEGFNPKRPILVHCVAKEEESHLFSGNCEIYGEIRSKYDNLNDDMNLVNFFNEVLAKRDEIDEKEARTNVP